MVCMAFKKIESSSSGSIPFFDVWIKELTPAKQEFLNGKLISPKTIKASQSGKGYMLNFNDEFSVFLWKGSSIGQTIKKSIVKEEGYLLLLQFVQTPKKFNYEIGFDDEYEVAISEEKSEEGMYYQEETNEPYPIAPSDNRSFIIELPVLDAKTPIKLTSTPKAKNKHEQRSDGVVV